MSSALSSVPRRALATLGCLIAAGCCHPAHIVRRVPPAPAPDNPIARVYLVGDTGTQAFRELLGPTGRAVEPTVADVPDPVGAPADASETPAARLDRYALELARRAVAAPPKAHTLLGVLTDHVIETRKAHPEVPVRVLWLGDNIYPDGVPPNPGAGGWIGGRLSLDGRAYVAIVASVMFQAEVGVRTGVPNYFVAGNHDWAQARPPGPGRARVLAESGWLDRWTAMRSQELGTAVVARMVPPNGCAGTFVETLGLANGRKLALVGLDTESLMNAPQEGCQPATREGVLGLVGSAVHAPDTDAIVFAHHPPASHGPHGGYAFMGRRDWTSWRNSLLGVVVGRPLSWIVHLVTGGRVPTLPLREDLSSGIYKRMARALEDAAAPAAGQSVIFAGGHDHSLQLLRRPSGALVAVSGSASNLTPICEGGRDLLLGLDKRGFMYADYFADGTVTLVALPLRMAADGAVLQVESPRPVTASGARRAGP